MNLSFLSDPEFIPPDSAIIDGIPEITFSDLLAARAAKEASIINPFAGRRENVRLRVLRPALSKPRQRVMCVETEFSYESIAAAARSIGRVPAAVRDVLDLPGRTSGGLTWVRVGKVESQPLEGKTKRCLEL